MEIKISDKEVRESIPIEIIIENAQGIPKISVEKMGKITPRLNNGKYTATFWAMKKGVYQITIKDKKYIFKESIIVKEQNYLSFNREFGFFIVVLFMVSIGVCLWMKKLKKAEK